MPIRNRPDPAKENDMDIERIGIARRWSDATIFNGIVFLSGHCAENTEGQSLAAQTEEVLAQIDDTLAKAGSSRERLLSVQIYLADISRIAEMNEVYDRWVAPGQPPARATVEARLASEGWAIEITAVAAKG
jgi:enamine deaminase RidA (YjgF/YER057c/UK114 family)